ncbi:pantoate--beta-alanine ligase [Octadecabacter sp. SW4]|uniref:pantoate--beta-alanine ligase n=1 Tax=Octadecabacter sp. SW4 TaxID=2602067 RepID=UPI0011C2072E|nr:pantoate--beta-alanine ligase [Octadecabacter sp. SW4]QEE36629.1 pantoate--beta-alanine ligase [Octadecabacter sp. SW4]
MQVCRSISDIRAAIAGFRAAGDTVGLVTTMGALHAGHMALVMAAKTAHARVVATIFVNPTQFGDPKDLASYPRTEDADLATLRDAGVDAVLIPDAREIYPESDETIVETTRLANVLHGLVRPGHYRGVATVVTKLFNITQPDAAYFGEKDYQQLQVIKRMARDLHMPLDIVGIPTVREPDGLAMSSRNVRLAEDDRNAAVVLSRALDKAQTEAGRGVPIDRIDQALRTTINAEPRARLRAVDIVEPATLAPATGLMKGPIAIMLSVEFGPSDNPVMLIDQREITP